MTPSWHWCCCGGGASSAAYFFSEGRVGGAFTVRHFNTDYSGYVDSNTDSLTGTNLVLYGTCDSSGYPHAVTRVTSLTSPYPNSVYYQRMTTSSWGTGSESWTSKELVANDLYESSPRVGIVCLGSTPYVLYVRDDGSGGYGFRYSYESGGTWSSAQIIDLATRNWFITSDEGRIYTVSGAASAHALCPYWDNTLRVDGALHFYNTGSGWTWSDVSSYVTSLAGVPNDLTCCLDGSGMLHYVENSTDSGNNTLRHSWWQSGVGWSDFQFTKADRHATERPRCGVQNGSTLHLIYRSTTDSKLYILRASAAGGWNSTSYPAISSAGIVRSLWFDSSGRPHVHLGTNTIYRLTDSNTWDITSGAGSVYGDYIISQ